MDANKYLQHLAIQDFKNVIYSEFEVYLVYYFENGLVQGTTEYQQFIVLISKLFSESNMDEVSHIEVHFAGKHFFDIYKGEIKWMK